MEPSEVGENDHLKVENLFKVHDSTTGEIHDVRAMLELDEEDFKES
jgi:hypothetical protein